MHDVIKSHAANYKRGLQQLVTTSPAIGFASTKYNTDLICSYSVKISNMQKPVVFAAVAFLLFGHIYSAAITRSETATTQSPVEQPTEDVPVTPDSDEEVEAQEITSTTLNTPPCPHANKEELQVDGSNPIIGDMPIFQDHHNFDIINKNCKLLQKITWVHTVHENYLL